MDKVKLPKEIVEALDGLKAKCESKTQIVERIVLPKGDCGLTIARVCSEKQINCDLIIEAVVNGYEVEQTPEDKVREHFDNPTPDWVPDSYREGIKDTLDALNIKIEGINT